MLGRAVWKQLNHSTCVPDLGQKLIIWERTMSHTTDCFCKFRKTTQLKMFDFYVHYHRFLRLIFDVFEQLLVFAWNENGTRVFCIMMSYRMCSSDIQFSTITQISRILNGSVLEYCRKCYNLCMIVDRKDYKCGLPITWCEILRMLKCKLDTVYIYKFLLTRKFF